MPSHHPQPTTPIPYLKHNQTSSKHHKHTPTPTNNNPITPPPPMTRHSKQPPSPPRTTPSPRRTRPSHPYITNAASWHSAARRPARPGRAGTRGVRPDASRRCCSRAGGGCGAAWAARCRVGWRAVSGRL